MEMIQSEATAARRRVPLHLVDGTDGITPETGEAAGQSQVSKNGAAFGNTSATLTAIGNGAYYVELTAGELDTLGWVIVRFKSANTAEFQIMVNVVKTDIFAGTAQTGDNFARIGAPAGASVSADIAAVKVDTAATLVDTGTTLPASIATIDTNVDAVLVDTGTTLPASIATVDANVDAILVDTADMQPKLGTPAADISADIAAVKVDTAAVLVDTGTTLPASIAVVDANVDAILVDTGTTLPASIATIDTNVDAILVDTGTTLPAAIATVDTNVDAILVDTGTTIPAQITALNNVSTAEVNTEVDTALSDFFTSSAQLVDDVWDEVLSGATHNVPGSAGRRLRTIQEFQGYEGGAIWVDTVNGTAGTTDFENGTVENPVLTWADALTLSASLGFIKFEIVGLSSITLTANSDNYVINGSGYTLALGGQSIVGARIVGANVSGIASGLGNNQVFDGCVMDATSHIKSTTILNSSITATQTAVEAGDIFMDKCFSGIAGTSTWIFDFGAAIGNTNLNVRHYSGGIQLENMGDTGTDTMSLEGHGQFIEGTCTSGTVSIRGHFTVSGITNLTLSDDARYDTLQINAEVDQGISDAALATAAALATVDSNVDAILVDTGTTIPAQISGLNDVSTAQVNAEVDTALSDIGLDHLISAAVVGADVADDSIIANMVSKSATPDWDSFDNTTDSQEATVDTGNASWTTGAGGTSPELLQNTTIATLATQTSFTLTAGSADNDAYNGCVLVVTDASTSTQKAVGVVLDYVGASKTITLSLDPGVFTMAVTDIVDILADRSLKPTVDNRTIDIEADGDVERVTLVDTTTANTDMRGTDSAATAAALATHDGKLDTVDANVDSVLVDTGTTLPASIATIDTNVDAVLVDTGTTIPAQITALNNISTAEVNTEVDTALSDIGLDHLVSAAVVGADITDDSIIANLVSKSATPDWDSFDNTTDSLEAVIDTGNASWTSATSDSALLQATTIATLASQTSFTLAAGSADDDAYNGCVIVITDASTATQKAVGVVSDYVGASKTITLKDDPGVFTMAITDIIAILADRSLKPTVDNRTIDIEADGDVERVTLVDTTTVNTDMRGTDSAATAAALATHDGKLDTVDTNVDSILVDTGTTIPGVLGTPAADISADIAAVKVDTAATLVDTGTTLPAVLGTPAGVSISADNAAIKVDTAAILVDTGTTIPATLGTPAADISADLAAVKVDTAAVLVDTAEIGVAGAGLTDLGGMSSTMKAQVNTEVVDVIFVDTIPELTVRPVASPTMAVAMMAQHMELRNKGISDTDVGLKQIHNAAGVVVYEKVFAEVGNVYTESQVSNP